MLSGVASDSFTTALLSDQSTLKYCSAAEFRQVLSTALNDHVIAVPRFDNQLRKLRASITEPAGNVHDDVITRGLWGVSSIDARLRVSIHSVLRCSTQCTAPLQPNVTRTSLWLLHIAKE